MRCCILLRLLTLFFLSFLAGQLVAFKIYQQPRLQGHVDPATKILDLKTALTTRMSEHHSIVFSHLDNISSNLSVITSLVDKSVSKLFLLKDQMQNLPQSILNDHFETLADHLKLTGKDSKEEIEKNLRNIKQSLSLAEKETDDLERFMQDLSDELMLLQSDILKSSKNGGEGSSRTELDPMDGLQSVKPVSSGINGQGKMVIEDVFKSFLESTNVFPHAYSVIPEEQKHTENAIAHARYTGVFNTTLPFGNHPYKDYPCDYSCDTRVEVKYNEPVADKEITFQYELISMNCTGTAPGFAKNKMGSITAGQSVLTLWFELASFAMSPEEL